MRIALMCAEKDPLQCHRTILVSRHLVEQGVDVLHILADGGIESHADVMRRLRGAWHPGSGSCSCRPRRWTPTPIGDRASGSRTSGQAGSGRRAESKAMMRVIL